MVAPEMSRSLVSQPNGWKLLLGGMALVVLSGLAAWLISGPGASRSLDEQFRGAVEAFERNDLVTLTETSQALQDSPKHQPHFHLLQGMVLLRSHQLFEAIEQFGLAKEHPETQVLAFTLAGEILYKVGSYRAAVSVLQEALAFDSEQADAHRWLAATYYDIGAMHDALRHLEIVTELDSDDPRPHRLRGLIYKDFEKYPRAVEAYEESLRLDPAQNEVLFELAQCWVQLRQQGKALAILQECEPTPEALTLAAECEYSRDNERAAEELLEKALAFTPVPPETYQLQATIALESKDWRRTAAILENAVEHYPKDFSLRFKLAQAYRRLGRDPEAEEQEQLTEELRELRYRFTELHDQAMDNPLDAGIRYQLGVVAQRLDMLELAQSWFRATLSLDPDFSPAQQALNATTP